MKIGIVADTHGYFDPSLRRLLEGVDVILHAGDVVSSAVLDELAALAPVRAVRGNVDPPELGLPPSLRLTFGDLQIEMTHIPPLPQSELEAWSEAALPLGKKPEKFLQSFDAATDVIVFGHSHQPCLVNLGGRLLFNPGSAGKRRFSLPRCYGMLETAAEGREATIRSLQGDGVLLRLRVRVEMAEKGSC